jgi:hypothetical protein
MALGCNSWFNGYPIPKGYPRILPRKLMGNLWVSYKIQIHAIFLPTYIQLSLPFASPPLHIGPYILSNTLMLFLGEGSVSLGREGCSAEGDSCSTVEPSCCCCWEGWESCCWDHEEVSKKWHRLLLIAGISLAVKENSFPCPISWAKLQEYKA